jgi:hypothetical protein
LGHIIGQISETSYSGSATIAIERDLANDGAIDCVALKSCAQVRADTGKAVVRYAW